jgi:hypothetical protein
MKTFIAAFLLIASTLATFAGETNEQPAHRIGDYVELPGAQGFLQYSGEHSGVKVYALSADIGSAVPSGDLRLYTRQGNDFRLVFSLPMLSRKGYHCIRKGDTLCVHVVSKYGESPDTNSTPLLVIDLPQLVKTYAEPSASRNTAAPHRTGEP